MACLHFISIGFPTSRKAGSEFWHCDETLHPSSQTKHRRGSQQKVAPSKSCSLSGEMKGICLLGQNIASSSSYGLAPHHGAVTLVLKVANVWLEQLMYCKFPYGWLQCLLYIICPVAFVCAYLLQSWKCPSPNHLWLHSGSPGTWLEPSPAPPLCWQTTSL